MSNEWTCKDCGKSINTACMIHYQNRCWDCDRIQYPGTPEPGEVDRILREEDKWTTK